MKDKILNIIDGFRNPEKIVGEGVTSKFASLKKLIIIFAVIGGLIWFNIGSIAELIVSDEDVKADLEKDLSDRLSAKVKINGKVKFSSKPEPNIIIYDIEIDDPNSAPKGKKFVKIKKLRAETTLTSIFSGGHNLKKIEIDEIEISTYQKNNSYNLLYFLSDNDLEDTKINIKNVKFNSYKRNEIDPVNDILRIYNISSFEIDPNPKDGEYNISGSFKGDAINDYYYFDVNLEDGLSSNTDYKGKIYSDDTEVILQGNMSISKDLKSNGTISGYVNGFTSKMILKLGGNNMVNHLKIKDKSTLSGTYTYNNKKFTSNDLKISGPIANYSVKLSAIVDKKIDIDFSISANSLKYNSIFKSRDEFLASKTVVEFEQDFEKRLEKFFLFAVNDDVNFNFNLKASSITFNNGGRGSLIVKSSMQDKVFKIEEFKLNLPGSSKFQIVSKIKVDRADKKLSGSMKFVGGGKNLSELSNAINFQGNQKNDNLIKAFYIKTKGYIYEKKVHFREIIAQFNKNKLAGQLLVDYTKDFSATSAITFNQLELDNYFKGDPNQVSYQNNIANKLDFIRAFDSFFDSLSVSISSKNVRKSGVLLQDFSMFTMISPGIVDVKDSFFYTKQTGDFRGSAKFDISEFQPKINLNLKLEKFDSDYILYGKKREDNDKFDITAPWSKKTINLQKLTTIIGKFAFAIDNLKISHLDLVDFRTSMKMEGERVIVDKSRFEVLNSKVSFQGKFTTEYPSFNVKYEASELDFQKLFKKLFGVTSVYGTFNSTGVLSSTGYSYDELIKKLNGRINIVSNGFYLTGFNLPAYRIGLAKVIRVEQVEIVSEKLLNSGVTNFGYFGTSLLVSAGKIIFSDMNLKSDYTSNASASGVIDFHKWNMKINSKFNVKTSDNYNVPISLVTEGKIHDRNLNWDYSAAKKYWEDKFYGGKIY